MTLEDATTAKEIEVQKWTALEKILKIIEDLESETGESDLADWMIEKIQE